jgi:hypothetical protein
LSLWRFWPGHCAALTAPRPSGKWCTSDDRIDHELTGKVG